MSNALFLFVRAAVGMDPEPIRHNLQLCYILFLTCSHKVLHSSDKPILD